ncbi:hypothetical protein [Ktedonobacter racemifer]|uniref:hypothetical protein n=1 Tax=Ktedonobacter racemifer TaxID=363277 RepID=UPI0012F9AA12|nr:hypothetical protein [Ktedonobacter racemifer]
MNEQQEKIFYRLLIDLFIDNPRRNQEQPQGRKGKSNEKIHAKEAKRSRAGSYQATSHK